MEKNKPETIENRWDILYRDYPEVYDQFADVPYNPKIIDELHKKFNLQDKTIADIGSGSGRSTIELARYAKQVLGIEPEKSMRLLAEEMTAQQGLANIRYIEGKAEEMPLHEDSVDLVVGITTTLYPPDEVIPSFIREASRVVKQNGLIIYVDVAPGWYGGELSEIIGEDDSHASTEHHMFVDIHGFSYVDIETVSNYGSLEKILATYGFIFGKNAINYIKKNKLTSIKWMFRAYYKEMDYYS